MESPGQTVNRTLHPEIVPIPYSVDFAFAFIG
jgi:hypothetical protein